MVFALLRSVVTMFSPESVASLILIESAAWKSLRGISGGTRVPGEEDLGRYGLFWGEVTFIKPETQANGETETAPGTLCGQQSRLSQARPSFQKLSHTSSGWKMLWPK